MLQDTGMTGVYPTTSPATNPEPKDLIVADDDYRQEGLDPAKVVLWCDWPSIHQDDKAEKLKGVMSLIKYATLSHYMLVPTEEAKLVYPASRYPEDIPQYGGRGWCRCEYFIFSLWAEMLGGEAELYAILVDGRLHRYPKVSVFRKEYMPSGGALSNPDDKAAVQGLEDAMIAAYGKGTIEKACKAGGRVQLSHKMLRDSHVPALVDAVEAYKVEELHLNFNQLGVDGAKALAEWLAANTTTTILK